MENKIKETEQYITNISYIILYLSASLVGIIYLKINIVPQMQKREILDILLYGVIVFCNISILGLFKRRIELKKILKKLEKQNQEMIN